MSEAWQEAVRALWPGATVSAAARGQAGDARRELVFLPDARRPRLLLPAGLPGASAAALRRYSHDLGLPQRVSRGLTAAAVRTGLPERTLRDRLLVTGGGPSIEDRLAELTGREVVVSVGLGSARANRKPILHALSPAGEPLAFVKVGDTPMARELIAGEAAALEFLAGRPMPGIEVPRVLHHGRWGELGLLVLSALPTSARGWRPRGRPPVAAMRVLAAVAGVERSPLAGSPYWAGIRAEPAALADRDRAARLAESIEKVEASFGAEELGFGAWHGDWTPWNMAWHRGTLRLWDWERFARGVPEGFDLLHYRLQEAIGSTRRGAGRPYETWPEGADDLLRPLELAGRAAHAAVHLYLLELCCRYQRAAEGPIGEPLRPQADALLELLTANAGSIL